METFRRGCMETSSWGWFQGGQKGCALLRARPSWRVMSFRCALGEGSLAQTFLLRRRYITDEGIFSYLKKIVDIYIAMAEGGFENPAFDPDESHWDDDDDGNDDQGDETTPFIPGSASTPSPFGEQIEIKTMQSICG